MRLPRYGALRTARKRRLKQKANLRYRRKNPTHRMKHGHNFVRDKINKKNPICMKCGEYQ